MKVTKREDYAGNSFVSRKLFLRRIMKEKKVFTNLLPQREK